MFIVLPIRFESDENLKSSFSNELALNLWKALSLWNI